jgi:putative ATP-dependent endonuclease of OLD family
VPHYLGGNVAAPCVTGFAIRNYRSVGAETVRLSFEGGRPLVLIGENNAGKSNITKAIELLLGERWPSSHSPEDHEFHGRDSRQVNIQIGATVGNVSCTYCGGSVSNLTWTYDDQRTRDPQEYRQACRQCSKTFVTKDTKSRIMAISVSAESSLTYQLSYIAIKTDAAISSRTGFG